MSVGMMSKEAICFKYPKNKAAFAGIAKLKSGIIKIICCVLIIDHKWFKLARKNSCKNTFPAMTACVVVVADSPFLTIDIAKPVKGI